MPIGERDPGALPNVVARLDTLRAGLLKDDLDQELRDLIRGVLEFAAVQHELNKRLWEGKKGFPVPHADAHIYGDDPIAGSLGGWGLSGIPVRTVSESTVFEKKDWLIRANAGAGAITITLPPVNDRPGRLVAVAKIDATRNAVTVDGNSTETIHGEESIDLVLQGEALSLISSTSGWVAA